MSGERRSRRKSDRSESEIMQKGLKRKVEEEQNVGDSPEPATKVLRVEATEAIETPMKKEQKTSNRCNLCKKKIPLVLVALTKCRCGTTFCMEHRYPEVHGCSFDFHANGKIGLTKDNPLVCAQKIQKI